MPNINPASSSKPFVPVTAVASDPSDASRPSSTVADATTGGRNTSERGASHSQQVASSSVSGSQTPATPGASFFRSIVQAVQKSFEVRQPPQKLGRSPDDDATRHSPPPKRGRGCVPAPQEASEPRNALNAAAPSSSSDRADGSAASASRPAHLFSANPTPQERDKTTPYFSDRRDNEADFNGEVTDDQERPIECRHLAMYWEEQFRANRGKVPYDRISSPENILRNVPVDRYENAYERPATVHLVTHDGWGAMIARMLREMSEAGEETRAMCVDTVTHSMALGLKIKQSEKGRVLVIQLYDPNRTTTHQRVAVSDNNLSAIERLTADDFIDPEELDEYCSGGTISAFFDRHIDVTRNQTGHVQTTTVTPEEMHLAMMFGLDDHIASRTQQILQSGDGIELLLNAPVEDEQDVIPGLCRAFQERRAEAIRAWGNVLLRSELSDVQQARLLHAQRSDGATGLCLALQEGFVEAIQAWGEVVLASRVNQAQLEELLSAPGSSGNPGLHMALQGGHADAVRAFGNLLLRSGLSQAQRATLLLALDSYSVPGVLRALLNGHAEAVRAWGEVLFNGLNPEMCTTVLSKIILDDVLATALHKGHAQANSAWTELVRNAGFTQESVDKLLAEGCPDSAQQRVSTPPLAEVRAVPESVPYSVPPQTSPPSHTENTFSVPDFDDLFSDEPEEKEMDEYANDILSKFAEYPVSAHDCEAIKQGISLAVKNSHSYLIDLHTADLIEQTLSEAVDQSATFRSVAGYSHLDNSDVREKIENIKYKNIYESDEDSPGRVIAICEAQEDPKGAFVSFSLAPDIDSEYTPSWKLGLIHEVIHHLTGSKDPEGEYSKTHLGPTEVIARKIAEEMKLPVPDFVGYDADERVEHLALRNNAIIGEGARRHGLSEDQFIERLLRLSETPFTPLPRNTKQKAADPASLTGNKPDVPGPSSAVPYRALSVPDWAGALPAPAQQRATQLATPGSWNNEGGDLMPFLLASEFPQVSFRILNGNHIHTFNDGQPRVAYLTREGNHYTPWVAADDGTRRQETVPPNGDCFFASAFFAVRGRAAVPAEIQSMRERFSRNYAANAHHYDRCLLDPDLMGAVSTTRALAVSRESYQARVASGERVELDEVAPVTRNARSDEQDGSLRGGARVQQAVNRRLADLETEVAAATAQTPLPNIHKLAKEYQALDILNEFARKIAVHRKNNGMDTTDAGKDAVLKVLVTEFNDCRANRNTSWQPRASDVLTSADIRNAIGTVVAQQENGNFEFWLDGWAPWKTYLKKLNDTQQAELGTLGNSGELTRLAQDARIDQVHQALMSAIDDEIRRNRGFVDVFDDNVERTHETFRPRLLRQAELLNTPMRRQAAEYLTSLPFLVGASDTLDYSDEDFSTDLDDRILLLQTLTQAVLEASPQGVKNTHNVLFHDHRGYETRHYALIRPLILNGSIMTNRRSDRDHIDQVTANLIPLLNAIVERQLPDNPQARANMQAQVADAKVVYTSNKCSGHSLVEHHTRRITSGLITRLPEFLQSSKPNAKTQEAQAIFAAFDRAGLLSSSARNRPEVAQALSTPASASRTAFLTDSLSPVRQSLQKSPLAKRTLSELEGLVRTLAPVVRQECARPMDLRTVYRFLALHRRMTSGGADMLYRAEYLGLIGRALVHPENHSLARYALNDAAVQRAMRASSLTQTDFDRLVRASAALTVDRSAVAENNSMEWNNPELVQHALSLAERYNMLSTLEVRARWNRHRLNNEVERRLKSTFEEQLRAAVKTAYKKAHLSCPGSSEMRRIIEKTWNDIKDKWISVVQEEAEGIFESHIGRVLEEVARHSRHDPEIIGEIQSAAVDVQMGGWLVHSALADRAQEPPQPVADTENVATLSQLYYDLTDRFGRSLTDVERLLGLPLTRGTNDSRLRQQGMTVVEERVSNTTMVDGDQILIPDPAGTMSTGAPPTLHLRRAPGDNHHEAHSNKEQQEREIRLLDATNARAALALVQRPLGEGGLGGAVYRSHGHVAWELGPLDRPDLRRDGAPARSAENRPATADRILQTAGAGVQPPQATAVRAGTDIQKKEFPGQAGVSAASFRRGAANGSGSDAAHTQETLRKFKNDRREFDANEHYKREINPGLAVEASPVRVNPGDGSQARERRKYQTGSANSGINLRPVAPAQNSDRTSARTSGQNGSFGASSPVRVNSGNGTQARQLRKYNAGSGNSGINLRPVSNLPTANATTSGPSGQTVDTLRQIAQEYRRQLVCAMRLRDHEDIRSADIPTVVRKSMKLTEEKLAEALAHEAKKEAEEEKERQKKREEEERKQQEESKRKEEEMKKRAAAASSSNTDDAWQGYYQMSPTGADYARQRVGRQGR